MKKLIRYKNLVYLLFASLIIFTGCIASPNRTEPEEETAVIQNKQPTAEPTPTETATVAPTETATAEPAAASTITATNAPPTSEQPTAEPTATPPMLPFANGEGQDTQLLLTTSKDSLALWQDGELTILPDTEGVFSAVFVGDSDTIVYVRGHEVWCMDMNTQAVQQIPLPPEILATIPDDNDWPEFLFWLTAVNNNQIVATVEQATTPYGTVLVDCDAYTSTSIELTNPGYPVVSPDSSKIAIAGRNAITVYDLISGESKVLLEFEHIATYTQAPFYPVLSWATDSTHLIAVIHPSDWWMEDVDEPTIVYRLYPESGEVETVASINRMLVREPSTAVPFAADKLAYSVPTDPATAPFGIIPTKQMILDLTNGAETLLFEDTAGFVGWDSLSGVTGFTGWNPTGDRIIFWKGDRPDKFEIGVYDFGTESRLEKRLPGKFSGWLTDTSFLYIVEDTLYNTLYYASIVDADFVTAELVPKIDRLHEARVGNYATETPQPTIATTTDGWFIYDSAYYSYTIAYPPEATLQMEGVSGFPTDEQPTDLSFEEYMEQLQETYPEDICLVITYEAGFVSVLAPFENGGKYADVCPGMGIGYDAEPISKTVMVNDMPYLAEGYSTLETDDGVWHGEFLDLRLEDGTRLAFGGGFGGQTTREAYAALEQVLLRIINSLVKAGSEK